MVACFSAAAGFFLLAHTFKCLQKSTGRSLPGLFSRLDLMDDGRVDDDSRPAEALVCLFTSIPPNNAPNPPRPVAVLYCLDVVRGTSPFDDDDDGR